MPKLPDDWHPRDERDARIEELEAEVERLKDKLQDQRNALLQRAQLMRERDDARSQIEIMRRSDSDREKELQAKIEAALALHTPDSRGLCVSCGDGDYTSIEHPCPTVEALTGGRD